MLVPSMTLDEIKKEMSKEYPIISNKARYTQQKFLHALRPHGDETIVRYLDYLSKYKNNWIIRFGLRKKDSVVSFMAYYYNEHGLVGIAPTDDFTSFTYHTAHFFKRFNERLHLNLTMPKDIIRAFMNENDRFHLEKLEQFAPGIYTVFCATRLGYVLGNLDENGDYVKMNTFITHDMLKGSQHDIANALNAELQKYKYSEGSPKG